MRNPKEAPPGEVAPYWGESKAHEFVGDLKIMFGLLTVLSFALTLFLLVFQWGGALFAGGILLFSAGGWATVLIVEARSWRTHRSAREAADDVTSTMAGEAPDASTASREVVTTSANVATPATPAAPEPGESIARTDPAHGSPAPTLDEASRQIGWGSRVFVGFGLVALVLAASLLGSNRLALGVLLFFVLAIFYGWPFLLEGFRKDGENSVQ